MWNKFCYFPLNDGIKNVFRIIHFLIEKFDLSFQTFYLTRFSRDMNFLTYHSHTRNWSRNFMIITIHEHINFLDVSSFFVSCHSSPSIVVIDSGQTRILIQFPWHHFFAVSVVHVYRYSIRYKLIPRTKDWQKTTKIFIDLKVNFRIDWIWIKRVLVNVDSLLASYASHVCLIQMKFEWYWINLKFFHGEKNLLEHRLHYPSDKTVIVCW